MGVGDSGGLRWLKRGTTPRRPHLGRGPASSGASV
jgi:hypothetical protein